ncbi:MAG: polyphosphate:AMP phosphotransferase [Planctomycetota bacterium]|jgi:polyphosphate:AMP phosphotransferase
MFETAELGQKVSRSDYKKQVGPLREQLLEAQVQLREEGVPVIALFAGVDGAGKGESANLLSGWMDARWLVTRAFDEPTTEERERPAFWRYWRDLPSKGQIGVFLSAWYHDPLLQHVNKEISKAEFNDQLDKILSFEKMLADDGAVILKFWMHLGKQAQRERFETLEADPLQRWRVTQKDWQHWRMYDQFVASAEKIIRRTDTPHAPWTIVEGADPHYYGLKVGSVIRDRITAEIKARKKRAKNASDDSESKPKRDLADATVPAKLDMSKSLEKKKYKSDLEKYQGLLNLLHRRAREDQRSTIVVMEGWDAGGKGGAIRRVTSALDARAFRVIPIAAPTDEEKSHHYLWRFWRHLPRAGRFTFFDRSWYGRVLVERVEGFATTDEWQRAYAEINEFEQELVEAGNIIVKFWMHITKEEQKERFEARKQTPYKRWKLTEEDWRNRERWGQYELAVHDMIERTSTRHAPWVVVEGNDKRYARIKVLKTVCKRMREELGERS